MTAVSGDSCRVRRNSVSPSIPGSRTSQIITSNSVFPTRSSASAPLVATLTRWPASRNASPGRQTDVGLVVDQEHVQPTRFDRE